MGLWYRVLCSYVVCSYRGVRAMSVSGCVLAGACMLRTLGSCQRVCVCRLKIALEQPCAANLISVVLTDQEVIEDLRGEEDDFRGWGSQFLDGCKERFGLEQHALTSAAEIFVGFSVFSRGPVAELMRVDFCDLIFAGAFDDTLGKRSKSHLGEEGENVDAHNRLKCQHESTS